MQHYYYYYYYTLLSLILWSCIFYAMMSPGRREYTVVVLKPDVLERGLEAQLLRDIQYILGEADIVHYYIWSKETIYEFYSEHCDKPFFDDLVSSLEGKESVALLVYGEGVVQRWRECMVKLRQIYGIDATRNSLHGSDSVESAKREKRILFHPRLNRL
jgi:nucleoside-diphosphate kinase